MNEVDYSAAAVSARLVAQSRSSDLRTSKRLEAKVDMAPAAVTARLRRVSQLRDACRRFSGALRR